MTVALEAALILKSGCGIGYDFSPIRPKHSHVFGAGAATSGVLSFMNIFDTVCSTIMSGGGRRGAQMGCLDIQHPEIEDFIVAKRTDGVLRYFNLSVLITDEFMRAVNDNLDWHLWFWTRTDEHVAEDKIKIIKKDDIPFNYPECHYFSFAKDHVEVVYSKRSPSDVFKKKIFKTLKARDLYDLITKSTYTYSEPGFLLIDRANRENNLWFLEVIRATNPCGEQNLSPLSNCLLGSMLLCSYISNPFTNNVSFNWEEFKKDVRTSNRFLDNVVELHNLPLKELGDNLEFQRRHGLGFTGLGSTLNMLGIKYNSKEGLEFAEKVSRVIAQESLLTAIEIAKEKGPAPFSIPEENRRNFLLSGYNKRLLDSFENKEQIIKDVIEHGVRWSHATSVAPTGTMSLTWGNNCSNGLEPVFANSYLRNIRVPGKKTKTQEEVFDYAYFEWKRINGDEPLPDYWTVADDLSVDDHINMQAVIQKYVDSSTSKTINVPTDYPYETFKKVYFVAWEKGLKGLTTFRFNPEVHGGVLVRKEDLENTHYTFILEDGSEISVKGSEQIEYDGEVHVASNLFDALKEGIYGNM